VIGRGARQIVVVVGDSTASRDRELVQSCRDVRTGAHQRTHGLEAPNSDHGQGEVWSARFLAHDLDVASLLLAAVEDATLSVVSNSVLQRTF